MCGLLGVVSTGDTYLAGDDIKILIEIGKKAQRRGVDASGLVLMEADYLSLIHI